MALTEQQKSQILEKYGNTFTTPEQAQDLEMRQAFEMERSQGKNTGFIADIKGIGTGIKSDLSRRGQKMEEISTLEQEGQSGARSLFQKAGQFAGGISDVIGQTVMGGIKALTPQPVQEAVGGVVQAGAEKVIGSDIGQSIIERYQTLSPQAQKDVDALLGISSLGLDVAGGVVAKKGATGAIKTAVKTTPEVIDTAKRTTGKLFTIAKEKLTKNVAPEKAVGEVLQSKAMTPSQTKSTIDALQKVDTTKVKTFEDLNNKLSEKISELAQKVDTDLGSEINSIPFEDLKVVKQSKAGQPVEIRFVEDALNQLDELYGKTGDLVEQTNIRELIENAKANGLTRLEVNDIARTYGQEFGQKAFNKIGEPLTSVNAQMFENVRKGLKDIARAGIKGAEARKADMLMSRLYNIQNLVKRNVESVNKLMNKIEERGLFEKFGYTVSKYADVLTGGSIRGLVGGILPRGAGYKTLNALDLEDLLQRNLNIIQEASKAKTTKQLEETIKKLNFDSKSFGKDVLKATTGSTIVGSDKKED